MSILTRTATLPLVLLGTLLFVPVTVSAAVTLQKPMNRLGTVGYWPFNGPDIVDKVYDRSGQGNDGYVYGVATTSIKVMGKIGQAVQFGYGDNRYVDVGSPASLDDITKKSVVFWIKGYNPIDIGHIVHKGFWEIRATNLGEIQFDHGFTGNPGSWKTGQIIPTNEWSMWVVTFDNTSATNDPAIYLNGQSVGISEGGVPAGTARSDAPYNLTIGDYSGGYETYIGPIDELRIYNRILTPAEISVLYRSGLAKVNSPLEKRLTNGLVGMLGFNGKDTNWNTNKTNDLSGYGNQGEMFNMATSTSPTIGKVGQALHFDGTDDYVAGPIPALSTPATLCAWYKISPTSDVFDNGALSDTAAMVRSSVANHEAFTIGISNDIALQAHAFAGALDDADGAFSSAFGTTDLWNQRDVWQHICGTFASATSRKVYLNGVEEGTNSANEDVQASNLYVGVGTISVPLFAYGKGAVDEVRVYNRVLSTSEIKQLYLMGAANVNHTQNNRSTNGLVGFWPFNGLDIDLASSTREVFDRSGQNNHGDWLNHASTTASGKVGQAIEFDGVDDIVNIGDRTQYEINNSSLTISAWAKTDTFPANNTRSFLVTKGGDGNYEYELHITTTSFGVNHNFAGCIYQNSTSCYLDVPGTTEIMLGEWYHIVQVYNHTIPSLTTYVNGVLDSVDTTTTGTIHSPGTSNVYIGERQDLADSPWDGRVDEVRMYNRALSAAEIKQLYLMGK